MATWEHRRVRSTDGVTKASAAAMEIDVVCIRNGGGTLVDGDTPSNKIKIIFGNITNNNIGTLGRKKT
jgi:hypothetical protein